MSYQVLARKWRPRVFSEMVGQEHVLRALINALDSDRIHHAFLFTGTRGIGKTTIARILAKSLNCEQGVSSKPCGECAACQEIDSGRFVDLIEVDAASRTKVEDTRELLDNVQYAPTRGRYKVYLIDEVHMLSNHSFNALLKTLEEPPPHIKFLLATTDPQKLPVTILSRCLQFNLRRLMPDMIKGHLDHILKQEGVEFDEAALTHLARAADGSMRDALSLLDQAIAYGAGSVKEVEVRAMLGTIEQTHVFDLLDALVAGDSKRLMHALDQISEQAPDYLDALSDLLTTLHHVALLQAIPDAYEPVMGDQQRLQTLSESLSPEEVQLFYQIGLHGRRDIPLAPDPRVGMEMTLLRMLSFRPLDADEMQIQQSTKPSRVNSAPATKPETSTASTNMRPSETPATTNSTIDWHKAVAQLGLTGALNELAMNCMLSSVNNNAWIVNLDPSAEYLFSKERQQRLQEELVKLAGKEIKLKIDIASPTDETPAQRAAREAAERQQAAQQAIENDVNVKKIIETFGAQIKEDTIQPIDE